MKRNFTILTLVFFASFASLSYTITIIRIFSISLWYHFAFMVISIAMLGIGASGTLLSVYKTLIKERYIPLYLLLMGISIPVSYLLLNTVPFEPARLSWDKIQILYISVYYVLLALPFFFFGMIISTAFSVLKKDIGYIYGADLTGAGFGSMLTLWLLYIFPPEKIVFLISFFSMLTLAIFSQKKIKAASIIFLAFNLVVLYFHPSFIAQKISPYKQLEIALKFPGAKHLQTNYSPFSRVDIFKSPAVRSAPGLSFKYLENLPEQTGVSVDAGDIYAITDPTDKKNLGFVTYLPSALPFEMSLKKDVLILEPKGGLSALIAEYYKSKNIYTIDSNPLIIRSVREYLSNSPHVTNKEFTLSGLGRSWLASNEIKFDLIDISLTGAMPSGFFGFSEDYRFTSEAFTEYIDSLKTDGLLAVNLFILPPPKTELRLLNTIAAAFENLGIKDISNNLAAVRSWGTITLIAKKSALSLKEINIIKQFANDRQFDLIYYPGIKKEETNIHIRMPDYKYFYAFKNLVLPGTRDQFVKNYIFDIKPVHDENPFFHYYLKLRNIKDIYGLADRKWQYFIEEGYLLPIIFVQVLLLSMLLLAIPATNFRGRNHSLTAKKLVISLSYFAFIGAGFMFIEISFIQKMILPLENPSYASAVVLSSILISSGIGALLSQRMKIMKNIKIILLLSFIILLYSLFLPLLMDVVSPYTLKIKIIAVFFMIMPAGVFMGVPFPMGLSIISNRNAELIPWAWAVNGCFSVLAPLLAVMLALYAGFKIVLLTGVLMYIAAFLSLFLSLKKMSLNSS